MAKPRLDENAIHMAAIRSAQVEVDARRREVEARAEALKLAKQCLETARVALEESIIGDEGGPLFDPRMQSTGRLDGIPKRAVLPLFDHGIQTVGELETFIAQGAPEDAVDRLLEHCAGSSLNKGQAEVVIEAFSVFQTTGRLSGEIGGEDL